MLLNRVALAFEKGRNGRRLALDLVFADPAPAFTVLGFLTLSVIAESVALPLLGVAAISATGEDAVIPGIDAPDTEWVLVVFGVLVMLRTALQIAAGWQSSLLAGRLLESSRAAILAAYRRARWETQLREGESRVIGMIVGNCSRAIPVVGHVMNAYAALLGALMMVTAALVVNWQIAALAIVVGLTLFVCMRPVSRHARTQADTMSRVGLVFIADLRGFVRTLREALALGVVDESAERATPSSSATARASARSMFIGQLLPIVYQGVVLLIAGGLLWVLATTEVANASEMAAATLLLVRALTFAQQFQATYHQLDETMPYLDDAASMFRRLAEHRQETKSLPPDFVFEHVEFDRVSFEYPDGRTGVVELTMCVERSEVVAVVGRSGAGKSTSLDLMLGLREPTGGRVHVAGGGQTVHPSALRDAGRIGYVAQQPQVLEGSLRENVAFFRAVVDDAILAALKSASLDPDELGPGGLDIALGPDDTAVSGGQAQRIAIARALVADPDVLILDEITSALDAESEAKIVASVRALKDRMAIVVVTHRPALLEIADRVIVLDKGRVERELRGSESVAFVSEARPD